MTNEFTDSVSMSYESTQEITKKHEMTVKGGDCMTVKQLVIKQTDSIGISTDDKHPNLPGFQGMTEMMWIKHCDEGGFGEPTLPDDDYRSAPSAHNGGITFANDAKEHTIDQE